MNIRDLQYLVALAEYKHFGKAANASFVSQPTLSAQLKKLEDYLGVQLIERTQRQVLVTPIGQEIIKKAKIILQEVSAIQELAKQTRDPFSATIKLGSIPTIGPYLLPNILPILKNNFPKLELFLFEEQTAKLLDKLKNAELDAAILAFPIEDESFVKFELLQEDFLVALPKEHPLTKKNKLKIKDLENETLLLLTDGHCLREQALDICRNVQIKQKHNFSATSLETLRQMVIAGSGITLLPEMAINWPITMQMPLAIRPLENPKPKRRVGLIWRKSSSFDLLFKQIGNLLKNQIIELNAKH